MSPSLNFLNLKMKTCNPLVFTKKIKEVPLPEVLICRGNENLQSLQVFTIKKKRVKVPLPRSSKSNSYKIPLN